MLSALLRASVLALSIVGITNSPAAARYVDLSGTHSKAQLKKDCDGRYVEGKGEYGCANDCDGTNSGCGVFCSEKTQKCHGWVPGRTLPPRTLGGILHPPLGGFKSGGNEPPRHHRYPVNVGGLRAPFGGMKKSGGSSHPVIYRSHGPQHAGNVHHSGGERDR